MEKIIKNSWFILVLLVFFSCRNNNTINKEEYINDNGQYQIDYLTTDGKLKRKVVFDQKEKSGNYYINKYDTIKSMLIDSIPYIEGKENGKRKEYFIDKKAFIYSVFVDGVENGLREGFYDNGNKYMLQNMIRGKREGHSYFYNSNGEVMSYEYFRNDERIFIMRYDKEYIDGNPILNFISEDSPKSKFKGFFILPKLENCVIEVEICSWINGSLDSCRQLKGNDNNLFYYSTNLDTLSKEDIKLPKWVITNIVTGKVYKGGTIGYDLYYYKNQ